MYYYLLPLLYLEINPLPFKYENQLEMSRAYIVYLIALLPQVAQHCQVVQQNIIDGTYASRLH